MYYSDFINYHTLLKVQLEKIEKELATMPDGKLIISKNYNNEKWYCSNGKTKVYIKKKNIDLAQKLAYKKYLILLYDDLSKKEKFLSKYLQLFLPKSSAVENLILSNPSLLRLISPFFRPLSEDINLWACEKYNTNPNYTETLIHQTISGHQVRSKSEAMIASLLFSNKIPFRYECELVLKEATLYPDFTIKHPNSGKIYYWEHFGMMDHPEYVDNTCKKLKLFCSNNIFPGNQLITTYETAHSPLSTTLIQNIINHYFK